MENVVNIKEDQRIEIDMIGNNDYPVVISVYVKGEEKALVQRISVSKYMSVYLDRDKIELV